MEMHCRAHTTQCWWVSINKSSSRELIADVQKRVTRLQKEYGLPRPYNLTVFETSGGLHAHIVFIGDRVGVISQALQRSKQFGGKIVVERAYAPQMLARQYLVKERTPQAGYGRERGLGGRIKGSHRLDGGGDRVRLSRDLERDSIEAGYVEPWQHENAQRKRDRKSYRPRILARRALRPAGQLPLLPELDRPVSRLSDFGGGYMPAAVALEVEFKRRRHGLSQEAFAARLGVSQGQYANAIRAHDPISAFAMNRAREMDGIC